jgi:hypothetical protein
MSNYTKATNFATKDSLPSGNPSKIVKGTEINDEFDAIETALNSKADINSPLFTGDPRGPTPSAADNDTSLATTAFVKTVISTGGYVKNLGLDDDIVDARALNVSGNGTSGDFLVSDGDGSFSWGTPASFVSRVQAPATSNPTTRDNGSALQEGDLYFNTSTDMLRAYDGSSWNDVHDPIVDLTNGASSGGTIPVGGHCIGRFNRDDFGSGESRFNGYASSWSASSSKHFDIAKILNRDTNGNFYTQEVVINYGTWKQMGGIGYGDATPDAYAALFLVRTA